MASSMDLSRRCFSKTEMKSTGTSVKGSKRFFTAASNSFMVLVSFSIRSHLFTSTTTPLPLRWMMDMMCRSCCWMPSCASIISRHTSLSSMARTDRSTL